jgi:hypothetical protein
MIGLGKNLKRKKAEYLIEEQAPNHRLCRPQIIGFAARDFERMKSSRSILTEESAPDHKQGGLRYLERKDAEYLKRRKRPRT